MSGPDPFAVLGLERDATLSDVRSARRRLAFDLHPDRGGSADQMRELNVAFDSAVAHITGRRPLPHASAEQTSQSAQAGPGPRQQRRRPAPQRRTARVQRDVASFVIDALAPEAFEALLIVISWIGEVFVEEAPYLIEAHLREPGECWCRLDLAPESGVSTVSLTVADAGGAAAPLLDDVRDTLVDQLNRPGVFDA